MSHTIQDFHRKLLFAQFSLNKNLEGLTAADSEVSPAPGGNNLNWNLGHILRSRAGMLQLIHGETFLPEPESRFYASELKDAASYSPLKWDALLAMVALSYERITQTVGHFAAWNDPSPWPKFFEDGESVGDHFSYLLMHETYHTGQIGLLRRIVNKPGKIGPPKR